MHNVRFQQRDQAGALDFQFRHRITFKHGIHGNQSVHTITHPEENPRSG